MKKLVRRTTWAVIDYVLYSPRAHAALVTLALGAVEAVRAALGHP